MSEIHEILKQIQKADYSLKHADQRQYKDFIDHKQEIDILIQNLSGFLRFKDNYYCVNLIQHLQNLSTDRERRDVLKRSEYIEIHNSIFNNNELPDDLKFWIKQEEITKKVLLYPSNVDEVIEESAGIPTVISQDCLNRSGFGAISQQI